MAFNSSTKQQKDRKVPRCCINLKGQDCIMPGRNPCYRNRIEEILWQEKMVYINTKSSRIHICDYHIEVIQAMKEKHKAARNKENADLHLPLLTDAKGENTDKEKKDPDEHQNEKKEEKYEHHSKPHHKSKKKHHKSDKSRNHHHKSKKRHHKKMQNESTQEIKTIHLIESDLSTPKHHLKSNERKKEFKDTTSKGSEKKFEEQGFWNSNLMDVVNSEMASTKSKSSHAPKNFFKMAALDSETLSTEEGSESDDFAAFFENDVNHHNGLSFDEQSVTKKRKAFTGTKNGLLKRKKRKRESEDSLEEPLETSCDVPYINTKEMFFALDCDTLMRYHQHFKLEDKVYSNKAQFANDVACHFASIPVVQEEVIENFIKSIKKDDFGRNHSP